MAQRPGTAAALAVLTLVLGVALSPTPAAQGHPISHGTPQITEIAPAAGSVVPAGVVTVSALIAADAPAAGVVVTVSGAALDVEPVDDGGHQRVQVQAELVPGSHVVGVTATVGEQLVERTWRFEAVAMTDTRLAGPTRTGTAAVIAAALSADDDARSAVLARGDDFADALAGVGLAHRVGGPLLLTGGAELDQSARQALEEHVDPGAVVHLLGGEAALSGQVAADVDALGFEVRRLAGGDRWETAAHVAETTTSTGEAAVTGTDRERVVVVASGEQFADALAISAPAALAGWPLLLTAAETLPDATRAYLQRGDVERIEIVGGTTAVSEAVAAELAALAPVIRIGGDDRYDTAARIARAHPRSTSRGAVVASGEEFADGLAGGVLAARRGQPLVLTAEQLPQPTAAVLAELAVAEVTVLGGEAAVPSSVVADVRRVVYDGAAPEVTMEPAPGSIVEQAGDDGNQGIGPIRLRLPGASLDNGSQATVWVGDQQAVSHTRAEGDTLVVELAELPVGLPVEGDVAVRVVASLQGADGGPRAHIERALVLRRSPQLPPVTTTPEGYLAIGEAGAVIGSGGPLHTYSLEVEPAAGIDVHAFAVEAESILSDPRSWTGRGDVRLQRVEPARARVRVLLATPATVDRLCARAGLGTGGIYSCWNGRFAALNLTRWNHGATGFDAPLSVYRGYLVNHEVGHGLGHGHVGCPGAGRLAPVMMQQTKGTRGCLPNAWPFPSV